MTKLTAIDLFSGCGGMTQGLKEAGFKVLGAVEIDHQSVGTYSANHQEVTVWITDIRELHPWAMMNKLDLAKGDLDLLAGCPPCQGFSTMRTLNGARVVSDPRNDLLADFQRFVDVLRPKTVMIENVPGLADDRTFKGFCEFMKEIGYDGDYSILNAVDYGVPQRRRRLIYLAGRAGRIPFAEPVLNRLTVRDAIGSLPKAGMSGDPVHDISEHRTASVKALISRIPLDGGSRTDLPKEDQLECHKKCDGFKDVYGRMAWGKPAPTITSGCFNPSKGRFLHPEENRAITMREAALLQGFPLGYKFPYIQNKSALAAMIGNALPPEFIRHHAGRILLTLSSDSGVH